MASALSTKGRGMLSIDLVGVASTDGGAIFSMLNPEGVSLLITRCYLYVASNSTGAANLNVGIGAAATTDATDIINALAMGAAEGKYFNGQAQQVTAKTEVTAPAIWTSTKYLNVTGSASTAGLTGTLYVEYVRV